MLVPRSTMTTQYDKVTAMIFKGNVTALTDHMAGTIACKEAEDQYPHYMAVYYEVVR